MYKVFDIADFFLSKMSMSPKKLQKLVYYAYGWTIALLNDSVDDLRFRLFSSRIEAWVHGPVIPELYQKYRDFGWQDIPKNPNYIGEKIAPDVEDIINQVYDVYGSLTANQLEMISHQEMPWLNARKDAPMYVASTNVIADEDMFVYFNEQAKN